MKNILKSMLAIAFVAMLSGYANAQSLTRLCFQTGTSVQSCQTVTTANPLPTTATLSASALSVTITNTPNVLETNSAAILSAVQGATPAGTNAIGSVLPNPATS